MPHQDSKDRCNVTCLKTALIWLFSNINWSPIKFRDDCTWTPRLLAAAGMFWALADETTLFERFQSVRKIIAFLSTRQQQPAKSYQAFIKLLRRWTPRLTKLLQSAFRKRMQECLSDCWKIDGWTLFSVDGSRIALPRTKSNEATYSATRKSKRRKKKGKKKRSKKHAKKANTPQMWITTMWHAGTGLPWDWRTGPSDSSERAHSNAMLSDLPTNAMLAADAGFISYSYAKAIMDSGRELLLRVGSNVRLLRKLGLARESNGTVYLWPDREAKKHHPPLVLRLIVLHNGKHPVYLVTSVCSKKRMSDVQASKLYRHRWGVEVFYRSLKQTFGRRKLRSASAENAQVELEWSLFGLWAMALYALTKAKPRDTTRKISIAQVLRAFRRMLRDYRHPSERGEHLCDRLRLALIDPYKRKNKSSRDYPRQKRKPPPGKPQINNATQEQRQLAKQITTNENKKG